jgi:hypothetical protein
VQTSLEQHITLTAGFHFGFVEEGGTSLYPSLAQRVTNREVLRILLSIGPTETMHFQTWHDKAGNALALKDPTNGLVFRDLNAPPLGGQDFQTNLIMSEPTAFLSRKFPAVSIIRPTATVGAGAAVATVRGETTIAAFSGHLVRCRVIVAPHAYTRLLAAPPVAAMGRAPHQACATS